MVNFQNITVPQSGLLIQTNLHRIVRTNCAVFGQDWDSNSELLLTSHKKVDYVTKKLVQNVKPGFVNNLQVVGG